MKRLLLTVLLTSCLEAQVVEKTPHGLILKLPAGWTARHDQADWSVLTPPDLLKEENGTSREYFLAGIATGVRSLSDDFLAERIMLLPFVKRPASTIESNEVVEIPGMRARMIVVDKAEASEASKLGVLAVEMPKGGVFLLIVRTPSHVLHRRKPLLLSLAKDVTHEAGGLPISYDDPQLEPYRSRMQGTLISVALPTGREMAITLRGNNTFDSKWSAPPGQEGKPLGAGTWALMHQAGKVFLHLRRARGVYDLVSVTIKDGAVLFGTMPTRTVALTGDDASPFDRTAQGLVIRRPYGWTMLALPSGYQALLPPDLWEYDPNEQFLAGVLLGATSLADPNVLKLMVGELPGFQYQETLHSIHSVAREAKRTAERTLDRPEGKAKVLDYTAVNGERTSLLRVYLVELPKRGVAFVFASSTPEGVQRREKQLEQLAISLRHEKDGTVPEADAPAVQLIAQKIRGRALTITKPSGDKTTLELFPNGTFSSTVFSSFANRPAVGTATGTWRLYAQGDAQFMLLHDSLSDVIFRLPFDMSDGSMKVYGKPTETAAIPAWKKPPVLTPRKN